MNKLLLKSLIIFLFSVVNSFSEIIDKIEVTGNKRISNETILVLGQIKKGNEFNNDQLNRSLKNLYKSDFFKDIDISFNSGILKIIVVENPIIEDIEIVGVKSTALL